jgi:3-oxoadipate enol-lactonase
VSTATLGRPCAGQLNIRTWGTGRPVVLVHGLGTCSRIWENQLDGLALKYRAITMDVRGFGESVWPANRIGGITDIVDDIIEVCESAGEAVHYLGTSMGGFFGQLVAHRRPELLRSLSLVNSAAKNVIPKEIVRTRLEALRSTTMEQLAGLVADQALGDRADPVLRVWLRAMIAKTPPDVYAHFLTEVLDGFDASAHLGAIRVPTLVLTGALDRVIPTVYGAELARLIPTSVYHQMDGVGHIACVENPRDFNQILLDFLASVDDVDIGDGEEGQRRSCHW